MSNKVMRMPELTGYVGLSRASIYAMMAHDKGTFPRPIKLGERAVGWRADDIDAWLAARPTASAA